MTDKYYSRPVIPLLLSMMSGIALGAWFPGHRVWAYPLIFLSFPIILYSITTRKTALISPVVLFIGLGYLSIQSWVAPEFPPHHIVHYTDTHVWKIVGIIDNTPDVLGNRHRFILKTETLENNKKSFPVTGNIRVTVSGNDLKLSRGDRVVMSSTEIKSVRNFGNPGGFDYKRYLAFKNIWGSAYVSEKRFTVIEEKSKKGTFWIIESARDAIADLIENSAPGKQQGVLKALIIGERNAVSPDLREAFNRAGIGHLLAISGLHIGIVATAAFVLFQWILSHFNLFLWNAWTKKGAVLLSVVPVLVYGLLSGMSPSTQRAVIMVGVFLMAFLFEREQDLMNTLALAAMLILVVHPPSLFSISFQLSFTAVIAIIYGMSRVQSPWIFDANGIKKPMRLQLYNKLFYFFLASFFAILGTLPLVMRYFNQISLLGLLTNFLIVPLVGFFVVPMGLFAVFLFPITRFGASLCMDASTTVLSQAIDITCFFSDLAFSSVKTSTPTGFEICCYYILFWAVLNIRHVQPKTTRERDAKNPAGIEQPLKREKTLNIQKVAQIAAVVVILALGVDVFYWLNHRFWHDDLRVTVIDVGQGSSTLLEIPGGDCLLIDGGGFSDNSIFDVGARIIAPLLWRKKIKTVDTLILTHPNSDHLNGLLYIAKHFHVKRIWSNNDTADTLSYQKFKQIVQQNEITMSDHRDIFGAHNINGVTLKIFYPPKDFIDKRKTENWRDINNNSLVIKVEFGSTSILFPGDIKHPAEKELIAMAGNDLDSTILISPHHGSKTSSTESFLDKVKPDFVIISSGWKNRFRFPHASVLRRYRRRGCRIFRTDRNGAIIISTDGQTLTAEPTIIDTESCYEKG